MASLHDQVRRTIRRHALIPRGVRVAVALSGGPDSVALLSVLGDLAAEESFELVGVAHLNHQLRGAAADQDERFCRRLAATRSLPIYVERIDVAGIARTRRESIERAAHTERYAFFQRAADRFGAVRVAVGHTRDDQAETFLLRLVRGAGPRGLAGIHPQTGVVIRPLIDTPRAEILAHVMSGGLEFREDATNADVSVPRNRVRHELIPYLRERFSPGIVDVLDREASIAREDAAFLDRVAADVGRRLTVRAGNRIEIALQPLLAEPAAIARRVIRDAQQAVAGGRFVGFETVEAVFALAVSKSVGPLDLPGHQAHLRDGAIVLTPGSGRRMPAVAEPGFSYPLGVPGRVAVPEASCAIWADTAVVPSPMAAGQLWRLERRGDLAVIEASRVEPPLVVRSRRPGDAFRPLGLNGHKKLQDFFVDEKVLRTVRDTIPVVVDSHGEIVWIAGHALADDFRVTDRTRAVVILRRMSLGGPG